MNSMVFLEILRLIILWPFLALLVLYVSIMVPNFVFLWYICVYMHTYTHECKHTYICRDFFLFFYLFALFYSLCMCVHVCPVCFRKRM